MNILIKFNNIYLYISIKTPLFYCFKIFFLLNIINNLIKKINLKNYFISKTKFIVVFNKSILYFNRQYILSKNLLGILYFIWNYRLL